MTLPTGTLTFLFTDIEGSTARWEHQREAMAAGRGYGNPVNRGSDFGLRLCCRAVSIPAGFQARPH